MAVFINIFTSMAFSKASRDQRHYSPSCSWPVNYDVTYQPIHGSAESFCHETWKTRNNRREFKLSGNIHHWKIPLFICISNLLVTSDKWKSYRPLLVAPDTISNENMWVIMTPSIHEPLVIVTSCWPMILSLFLWTLPSQWRCQPGTFQHGGSSWLHVSQCIA